MITEQDLDEAIAKCQGEEQPTNNTCIRMAAFLTIKDHLYPQRSEQNAAYSYSDGTEKPIENTMVNYNSDSEFFQAANGMELDSVFAIVDELMETLQIVNPRLYAGVIRKISE